MPGVDEEAPEVNELAIAALALSIVWLFGFGSIAGLVLARRALVQISESGGREEGRSLAIAAIVAAFAGLFGTSLIILIAIQN